MKLAEGRSNTNVKCLRFFFRNIFDGTQTKESNAKVFTTQIQFQIVFTSSLIVLFIIWLVLKLLANVSQLLGDSIIMFSRNI